MLFTGAKLIGDFVGVTSIAYDRIWIHWFDCIGLAGTTMFSWLVWQAKLQSVAPFLLLTYFLNSFKPTEIPRIINNIGYIIKAFFVSRRLSHPVQLSPIESKLSKGTHLWNWCLDFKKNWILNVDLRSSIPIYWSQVFISPMVHVLGSLGSIL